MPHTFRITDSAMVPVRPNAIQTVLSQGMLSRGREVWAGFATRKGGTEGFALGVPVISCKIQFKPAFDDMVLAKLLKRK